MQLSVKAHNACLAALELARSYDDPRPVCLKDIARAHRVSSQFLVQILSQLKRAGLVHSVRGAGGGYRLARSPEQICLLDILVAVEGQPSRPAIDTTNPLSRLLDAQWSEALERFQTYLSATSLAQLASQASTDNMYYI